MTLCTICHDPYTPEASLPSELCPECYRLNFHGASPPLGWGEVEAAALALTPRQVQALTRIVARQRQQEDTP